MRYPALFTTAIALLAVWSCTTSDCPRPDRPSADAPAPSPGNYAITFVATVGATAPSTVSGALVLVPGKSADTPLYGWLSADLSVVSAPLDPEAPLPSSQDPNRPGVLLRIIASDHSLPHGTPVLTIGTPSNQLGVQVEDGAGIGLWVDRANETGFSGQWRAWGIVQAGSGYFCAQRQSSLPAA